MHSNNVWLVRVLRVVLITSNAQLPLMRCDWEGEEVCHGVCRGRVATDKQTTCHGKGAWHGVEKATCKFVSLRTHRFCFEF